MTGLDCWMGWDCESILLISFDSLREFMSWSMHGGKMLTSFRLCMMSGTKMNEMESIPEVDPREAAMFVE